MTAALRLEPVGRPLQPRRRRMAIDDAEQPPHLLTRTVAVTPDMANTAGVVPWEALRALLNDVAHACASRYAGAAVLMLSADEVMFLQPVHLGDVIVFLAAVNYASGTSMEIGIRTEAAGLSSGLRSHVSSSFFTMQAVDASRRPLLITPLLPRSPDARRRHDRAVRRRQLKEEFAQQLKIFSKR